ncbi:hypothetical protein AJ87_18445 [Rhizobium yanglingense]|nr:hypothetical protein AJ87_18445 [Rhizobium yanglingense]
MQRLNSKLGRGHSQCPQPDKAERITQQAPQGRCRLRHAQRTSNGRMVFPEPAVMRRRLPPDCPVGPARHNALDSRQPQRIINARKQTIPFAERMLWGSGPR